MIAVLHSSQLPSHSRPPHDPHPTTHPSSLHVDSHPLRVTKSILLNHVSVCARLPMSRCSNLAHGQKKKNKYFCSTAFVFWLGCALRLGGNAWCELTHTESDALWKKQSSSPPFIHLVEVREKGAKIKR